MYGQVDSVNVSLACSQHPDVSMKSAPDNRLAKGDLLFTLNAAPSPDSDISTPPTYRTFDEFDESSGHAVAVVGIHCLNGRIRAAAIEASERGQELKAGTMWHTNSEIVADWARPIGLMAGGDLDASMREVSGGDPGHDVVTVAAGGRAEAANGPVSIFNAGHSYDELVCGKGSVLYVQFSEELIVPSDGHAPVDVVIATIVAADDPCGRVAVGPNMSMVGTDTDMECDNGEPDGSHVARGVDQKLTMFQDNGGVYVLDEQSERLWRTNPLAHPANRILVPYGVLQEDIRSVYTSRSAFLNCIHAKGTVGSQKCLTGMSVHVGTYSC